MADQKRPLAERVRTEIRSSELRNGDRLLFGSDQWGTVVGCWHTDSSCGAAIQGLYYALAWSEYEVLTVMRHSDGRDDARKP